MATAARRRRTRRRRRRPGRSDGDGGQRAAAIDLAWGAATDNVAVTGYRIERCQGAGCTNFAQIAAPTGTGPATATPPSSTRTSYSYRVRATDAAGNLGAYGNTATAVTPTPRHAAADRAGHADGDRGPSGRIDLGWTAATDNVAVTGYRIERCQGAACTNFAQIAAPAGTGTSYSDTSVAREHELQLPRPRHRRRGEPRRLLQHRRPRPRRPRPTRRRPRRPERSTATAVTSGRIDLAWGAATDNVAVTGYRVERCQGTGCTNFAQIAAPTGTGTSLQRHERRQRARATATASAPPTPPPTSAPTATSPPPRLPAGLGSRAGRGVCVRRGYGDDGRRTPREPATRARPPTRPGRLGQVRQGAQLQRRELPRHVPDCASLHLTTAMTLEAWVNPSDVTSGWRDVIYKGNDNYYLEATSEPRRPAGGGAIIGGSYADSLRHGQPRDRHVDASRAHLRRRQRSLLRQRRLTGRDAAQRVRSPPRRPAHDRQRPLLRPVLRRAHRRRPHLQHRAHAGPDPDRHGDARRRRTSSDPTPPTVAITLAGGQRAGQRHRQCHRRRDRQRRRRRRAVLRRRRRDAAPRTRRRPTALPWDTRTVANGAHTLTARARDAAGNTTLSAPVTVNVANANSFQNEVLATGFNLPTASSSCPTAACSSSSWQGRSRSCRRRTRSPTRRRSCSSPTSARPACSRASTTSRSTRTSPPTTSTTSSTRSASPNRDRLSRFTANATLTGTVAGSELVLYQDPQDANAEHHGGAINFGNDGKLYFTTGEHFNAADVAGL